MPEDQGTLSGATLGEYQVGTLLGVDGALAMYRTLDPATGADLALAVLGEAAIRQSDLLNVIRSVVALKHTHIIPVYDVGVDRGLHFVIVPMLRDALRERLARDGALSPMRAGQLVAQVAWAVVAMRESGLPEPPITTSNILLDDEGLAILADTALARGGTSAIRAFQPGGATGLPVHVAPFARAEVRRPVLADQREQVYSLGTVLYELLTATEKPANPTAEQTETLMVTAPLSKPSGRGPELWLELEGVMLKALSAESERFKDIREFAIEIRRVVSLFEDDAPSGKTLAVLRRGRRTSPPAFRLEEWALTQVPRALVEGQPEEVAPVAEPAAPVVAAWEEIAVDEEIAVEEEVVFGEEVAGGETSGGQNPVAEDAAIENGASENGATEPPGSAALVDQPRPTPASGAYTRAQPPGRRGRVASVPLRKNQPVSAAELRARLGGGPAPIPVKRLAAGAQQGQTIPLATPAPPSRPMEANLAPPRPRIPAAPLLPPTPGATADSIPAPAAQEADTPLSKRDLDEMAPANDLDTTPSPRDLDATTQLPFRTAPTAELLAVVAARTVPAPVNDVRVRTTEPPELSAIAVRPVFGGATPSMYLGGAQMRLPRRRGERHAYPLVVLAVLALVVALGGAGAIALGAIAPSRSNNDNNTIVISATQTAQARNAAQPTTTPTIGTTSPARPNVTPTPTSAPVGALVVETPTPTPLPPTATPVGPAISIAPITSTATNTAGSCSASFTISARQAGLSWVWQNDATSPATLPASTRYSVNGTPGVGLPVDASTTQAADSVVVTIPCNATPITYVVDLMSGGASTLYAQFTVTA